jgi:hypothetical protein
MLSLSIVQKEISIDSKFVEHYLSAVEDNIDHSNFLLIGKYLPEFFYAN